MATDNFSEHEDVKTHVSGNKVSLKCCMCEFVLTGILDYILRRQPMRTRPFWMAIGYPMSGILFGWDLLFHPIPVCGTGIVLD